MQSGWFMRDGQKVVQSMVFPSGHPKHPSEAKGMQQVLLERGFKTRGLHMKCRADDTRCDPGATSCCAYRILELQPDFLEQKSLVQEVIKAAGIFFTFNF